MKCLLGHKFILLGTEIVCEHCGIERLENRLQIKKDFLGRPKKSIIIKKSDDIDKILEK
jgi:superfamily II helicase